MTLDKKEVMKKVWNIVGSTIFWCAVVAFFVATALLRSHKESARRVERLEVVVKDADQRGFLTPEIVSGLIDREGLNPVGKALDSIDLARINHAVEAHSFTKKAITYVDYEGTLTVEVTQREPVMRVRTSEGHDFYLTRDVRVLPAQPHATLNLPIVTGDVKLLFGKSFEGSLREWLAEGEKNQRENYNFLCKLINFVTFTEEDEWLAGRIVQINLTQPTSNTPSKGFQEPEIEVIPSDGGYVVELGRLERMEEKIARWRTFTEAQVVDMKGGRLNVQYHNQALWQAPKAVNGKKKSK